MQRTRTYVDVLDDIDQAKPVPVDTLANGSVTLMLDDVAVDLDLTAEHEKELRELLQPWLMAGRPVPGSRKLPGRRMTGPDTPRNRLIAYHKQVVAWGLEHDDPEMRERAQKKADSRDNAISVVLTRAYDDAHPDARLRLA